MITQAESNIVRALTQLPAGDADAAEALYRRAIAEGVFFDGLTAALLRIQPDPADLSERLSRIYVEAFGMPHDPCASDA